MSDREAAAALTRDGQDYAHLPECLPVYQVTVGCICPDLRACEARSRKMAVEENLTAWQGLVSDERARIRKAVEALAGSATPDKALVLVSSVLAVIDNEEGR